MFGIFDDIFDFNGDGKVDLTEEAMALDILSDDDHGEKGQLDDDFDDIG